MREIDVNEAQSSKDATTFMIYGPSGGGKTRFSSTFPRPLFLSDVVEGGYETIRTMPRDNWYEPTVAPLVWGIETPADVLQAPMKLREFMAKNPGRVLTLVTDSLTFISDLMLDHLFKFGAKGKNGEVDKRNAYGELGSFLRSYMIGMHQIPGLKHIIWLGISEIDDHGVGSVVVPGKSRIKVPAACKYIFYQRTYREKASEPIQYETWTRPMGPYMARGRDDGRLPDTLVNATFRDLQEAMGWEEQIAKPKLVPRPQPQPMKPAPRPALPNNRR